ncbi:PREDICTED: basic leucine zipper [Prunus dulcis]|uniref:PREDICTED: basic leucine zipper n=1 Tax=Prunus dulcis TaxID=3755 RepID=A0A5E4EMG3_PRUDU|nr:basic leucine zipper 61-like isoform X2 [Prunus dulcis]VVA16622.1 PREDICTED: basic leucine zipper [Prunus dulcis]
MAQLPPKIPSMAQNWASFPHQRLPTTANFIPTTTTSAAVQPPSQPQCNWIDEFLDFSSARRGVHRRSASDSIAFMESPLTLDEECRNPSTAMMHHGSTNNLGFDRLDDEQLMSMFSDDMSVTVPPTVSSSNPSTPSDQNSNNDENNNNNNSNKLLMAHQEQHQQHPKSEPGEDESSCEADPHAQSHPPPPTSPADPKRVKRILANRQSAQRSRVRKLQYISELERSVTTLQSEVSALSPRVAFLDHQRLILNVDNSALKQRIAALAQDKLFKDAHQEALKNEIERLRQVYHHQSLKKMGNQNAQQQQQQHQQQQQPNPDVMVCTDHNEQQILN